MKKELESTINLEKLAGGAFAEKLNEALTQIGENIQNPNTDAATKRRINITLTFAPNKQRNLVNTTIAVTTKLAATEAIDTQIIMGVNMRNGKLEMAEYDGQIPGQMSIDDIEQAGKQAAQIFDKMVEAAENETDQQPAEDPAPVPTGKPLDLKNRTKQSEAAELVPGKDVDPDTGEVLDDHRGKVVTLRAAEA